MRRMLELAASDPMPPVRIAALDAIADIGDRGGAAEAVAAIVADAEPEVGQAAILCLGRIGGEADLRVLVEQLSRGDRDRALAALEAIGRLRLRAAVPAVRALAADRDDAELRSRAVTTLAEIGGSEAATALLGLSRIGRLRRSVHAALRRAGMS